MELSHQMRPRAKIFVLHLFETAYDGVVKTLENEGRRIWHNKSIEPRSESMSSILLIT